MHYTIPVVFRVTRRGEWKDSLDVVYADIKEFGLETANSGDRYSNEWYLNETRPAKPEEYAEKLAEMNSITLGEDSWEFIPVRRRVF